MEILADAAVHGRASFAFPTTTVTNGSSSCRSESDNTEMLMLDAREHKRFTHYLPENRHRQPRRHWRTLAQVCGPWFLLGPRRYNRHGSQWDEAVLKEALSNQPQVGYEKLPIGRIRFSQAAIDAAPQTLACLRNLCAAGHTIPMPPCHLATKVSVPPKNESSTGSMSVNNNLVADKE